MMDLRRENDILKVQSAKSQKESVLPHHCLRKKLGVVLPHHCIRKKLDRVQNMMIAGMILSTETEETVATPENMIEIEDIEMMPSKFPPY